MKKFITVIYLCCCYFGLAYANSPYTIRQTFRWSESTETVTIAGEEVKRWVFEGAHYPDEAPALPYFFTRFSVEGPGALKVEVVEANYRPLPPAQLPATVEAPGRLTFRTNVAGKPGGPYYGYLAFTPVIAEGGAYRGLTDVTLRVTWRATAPPARPKVDPTNFESVLRDGQVYKIRVSEAGVHRLSYSFLKDELGLNPDELDPDRLHLYGRNGGMLPFRIEEERIDDLAEIPFEITGGGDGRFDSDDFLLFYAEGADRWIFDGAARRFRMEKNVFDDYNYYYLKVADSDRTPLESRPSLDNTTYTTGSFLDYARFEEEERNLFHEWEKTQGSGRRWYGDHFDVARAYEYPNQFSFPNLIAERPVYVRAEAALRSLDRSRFFVDVNGQTLESDLADDVLRLTGNGDNETTYAYIATVDDSLFLSADQLDLVVRYPAPGGAGDGSEGWIDYIQVNAWRELVLTGGQLAFSDPNTLDYPSAAFQLEGAGGGIVVWDVTDPLSPRRQEADANGGALVFGFAVDTLRRFVAFDPNGQLPAPEAMGQIDNQNLHAIDNVDMVIVYHPDLEAEVQRLTDHRRSFSGLEVAAVTVEQIFNEFSSGRMDPTAIRDFASLLYQRNDRFRYLLLFGDGSFDYRDYYGLGANLVPVYEKENLNPIFGYPSDDYYALLDGNGNGNDPLAGQLSIAVGRLPVKSAAEAAAVVDKIIKYDQDPAMLRDWRNRIVFLGDDEDGNRHTGDADSIADDLVEDHPFLNTDKVYLDAFPQESTPGGARFPLANEAINRSIFRGVLAMTYLGHGGPKGLAQERVLNISDILSWDNIDRTPLLVTATCSFTGYDDPAFVTAGEEAILNPRGGAIALYTTTRAVYASQNEALTRVSLDELFRRDPQGQLPTLGEALTDGKNTLTSGGSFATNNARKFSLIGDPAMYLAIPQYQVVTSRIDSVEVQPGQVDTLRALQRISISGYVADFSGQPVSDFNGILYPTVFDKATTVTTLAQDQGSPEFDFQVQKNIIFKGRASVTNGNFSFEFVAPKDINYQYGFGKISYYAADESALTDGAGSYERVVIGGTRLDGVADDQGPQVDVFMNSEDFVFGGVTDENPVLLVKLADDFGINVAGNSIGHDLEAILNGNTQNTYLLNDFYEAELDDFTKGEVRFPLSDIPEGRHEIAVKAWDVANNSAQGFTEFIVATSAEVALEHVLNYPNPFTDRTCFQFDHNMSGQELDVLIQVYTISGRLVKTIERTLIDDGAIRLDNCIEWDGRDDFGDRLARGVYLYKVKVRANLTGEQQLTGESEFERLVILK